MSKTIDNRVSFSCGISSGICQVGFFGSSLKQTYSVVGDYCNVASRILGMTSSYGCPFLFSESLYSAFDSRFFCRWIDCRTLKGKKQRTDLYELIIPKTLPISSTLEEEIIARESIKNIIEESENNRLDENQISIIKEYMKQIPDSKSKCVLFERIKRMQPRT